MKFHKLRAGEVADSYLVDSPVIRLTQTLKNALTMVGTTTLDHFIVGSEGIVSLAEQGLL